jgi:hypothetical protein
MSKQQNRPLGWTTIEESKKLVEAGLNPETADMSYRRWKSKNGRPFWEENCVRYSKYLQKDDDGGSFGLLDSVNPCWSLGRLIALFPSDNNGEHVEVARVMKSKYFLSHWSLYFIDPQDHCLNSVKESVLIDGVVKMVLLCLEHGIIQKGGKNEEDPL